MAQSDVPLIIERYTDTFGTLHVLLRWDTGEVQHLSRDEGDHASMTDDLKQLGAL